MTDKVILKSLARDYWLCRSHVLRVIESLCLKLTLFKMFCHSELYGPFQTDALEILQSKGSHSGSENSCLMPLREQKGWGGEREGLFWQHGEAVGISMPLKLFAMEFSKFHNFLTRPCGRNAHAAAFR